MRYLLLLLLLAGCGSNMYLLREPGTEYTCNRGEEMLVLRVGNGAQRYFYNGTIDSIATITYKETVYYRGAHLVRPHATQELRYDLREGRTLIHQQAHFQIVNATSNTVTFQYRKTDLTNANP